MLEQGWDKRPGVRILFGRWQDVLPDAGLVFDGIFWDTFSEFYEDMQ
jgi:protein arginine N-methyltransferase 2